MNDLIYSIPKATFTVNGQTLQIIQVNPSRPVNVTPGVLKLILRSRHSDGLHSIRRYVSRSQKKKISCDER